MALLRFGLKRGGELLPRLREGVQLPPQRSLTLRQGVAFGCHVGQTAAQLGIFCLQRVGGRSALGERGQEFLLPLE